MNPFQLQNRSAFVKQKANELGFSYCGISKADFLEEEAPLLERWLKEGKHGTMQWMENHFDKRLDPRLLVEGAKSVISLMLNYYPQQKILYQKEDYKISKYAYGRDYHKVIKKKLKHFLQLLQTEFGEIQGRAFVDSAPVMDKSWAKKSGIAWQGKHSNLITKKDGSFLFVAELIVDIEMEYDAPIRDYCANCRLCIDACPTQAIVEPYVVDGSKCISYFTIELQGAIPSEMKGKFENWIFGCDVCQDVCPWNRRSKPHTEPDFLPSPHLEMMKASQWKEITEEVFEQLFQGSAVKRTGLEGLKRNIKFIEE